MRKVQSPKSKVQSQRRNEISFGLFVVIFFNLFFVANAQNAPEITVSLNEQFLNSFLDSVFNNLDTPKFQLSEKSPKSKVRSPKSKIQTVKVSDEIRNPKSKIQNGKCDESITLLRENGGVK
ncbi:MAG: hypothetical protein H7Z37_06145, partial [Pyrinomonadaceae bacterium]|nr:hypothetical protein [Pyrinomonadaceae bacterium]